MHTTDKVKSQCLILSAFQPWNQHFTKKNTYTCRENMIRLLMGKWLEEHHSPPFKTNKQTQLESSPKKLLKSFEAGFGLILADTVAPLNFLLVYLMFKLTSLSVLSHFSPNSLCWTPNWQLPGLHSAFSLLETYCRQFHSIKGQPDTAWWKPKCCLGLEFGGSTSTQFRISFT